MVSDMSQIDLLRGEGGGGGELKLLMFQVQTVKTKTLHIDSQRNFLLNNLKLMLPPF